MFNKLSIPIVFITMYQNHNKYLILLKQVY